MFGAMRVVRRSMLPAIAGLLCAAAAAARAEQAPAPQTEIKVRVEGPVLGPAEAATPEEKPQGAPAKPESESQPKEEPKPEPPELGPEVAALRAQVRRTLAAASRTVLNTRDHSATDLMYLALAFGCNAEAQQGGPGGQRVNAIAALCHNYACAGREPLTRAGGRVAPRVGFGLQTQRGQLLAVLAQARVPDDYPVRVGEDTRTVADLVEYEKLACRAGVDQSQALIGLSYYLAGDSEWKNGLGETWSLGRLVDLELEGPITGAPDGGLHRLMALSHALSTRAARKQPVTGPFEQARQYVEKYHGHAFRCQNEDGSWNPAFFAAIGPDRDAAGTLRATGHVVRWLAFSLPEEKLADPRMVKAVARVVALLEARRWPGANPALSPRDLSAVMHALHGLAIYEGRLPGRS